MSTNCTLSINVARTDIPFMMMTIPHLVKMCNFDFEERVLIVDTNPMLLEFETRPGIGTIKQLLDACKALQAQGIIDSIVEVDLLCQKQMYEKHFGAFYKDHKSFRGCPIFNYVFAIESCKTEYFLHFDSDMLLHQSSSHSYIKDGLALLKDNPDIMFVLPLPGPLPEGQKLSQPLDSPYTYDSRGFYSFKNFTSRKFLMSRSRFEKLMPMEFLRFPPLERLRQWIKGESSAFVWEAFVTQALKESTFVRADLASPKAWALHLLDRDERLYKALPDIIKQVEAGYYPQSQVGKYDLDMAAFINM